MDLMKHWRRIGHMTQAIAIEERLHSFATLNLPDLLTWAAVCDLAKHDWDYCARHLGDGALDDDPVGHVARGLIAVADRAEQNYHTWRDIPVSGIAHLLREAARRVALLGAKAPPFWALAREGTRYLVMEEVGVKTRWWVEVITLRDREAALDVAELHEQRTHRPTRVMSQECAWLSPSQNH